MDLYASISNQEFGLDNQKIGFLFFFITKIVTIDITTVTKKNYKYILTPPPHKNKSCIRYYSQNMKFAFLIKLKYKLTLNQLIVKV